MVHAHFVLALGLLFQVVLVGVSRADSLLVAVTDSAGSNDGIYRFDLDGTNQSTFISSAEAQHPTAIVYSNLIRRVFWVEDTTGRIRSADYTGSDIKTLATIAGTPRLKGIAIDEGFFRLFVTDSGDGGATSGKIYRLDPYGFNPPKTVVTGIFNPAKIVADDQGNIFWAENRSGGGVMRASITGTSSTVITLHTNTTSVAVDKGSGEVYSGGQDGLVDRSASDGSAIVTLTSGLTTVQDVVLSPAASVSTIYLVESSGVSTLPANGGTATSIISGLRSLTENGEVSS